jgi:hypothetical protein
VTINSRLDTKYVYSLNCKQILAIKNVPNKDAAEQSNMKKDSIEKYMKVTLGSNFAFDPQKALFGLHPDEAFKLTEVLSQEEYLRLKERLPKMRGFYYFFIKLIEEEVRLVATVIIAEGDEVTRSFVLDHESLGISSQDLLESIYTSIERFPKSGNFPISDKIEQKIREAVER